MDYDPDELVADKVYIYLFSNVNYMYKSIDSGGVFLIGFLCYKVYKEDDNEFLGYQWTTTGQRDFLRAHKEAEERDAKDRKLCDENISHFLGLLSERSRVLMNNTAGFKEAVRDITSYGILFVSIWMNHITKCLPVQSRSGRGSLSPVRKILRSLSLPILL